MMTLKLHIRWRLRDGHECSSKATSGCPDDTGRLQVTKKAVEEAGQKAVLLPGGLEDDAHIK